MQNPGYATSEPNSRVLRLFFIIFGVLPLLNMFFWTSVSSLKESKVKLGGQ